MLDEKKDFESIKNMKEIEKIEIESKLYLFILDKKEV